MSLLEDKANQIAADSRGENPTVFVDPATILAIISIITQVVKMYQGCKKSPAAAQVAMKAPTLIQRMRLRRIVRQHLAKNYSEEHVGSIVDGVLKQGKEITPEEVSQLYEEV